MNVPFFENKDTYNKWKNDWSPRKSACICYKDCFSKVKAQNELKLGGGTLLRTIKRASSSVFKTKGRRKESLYQLLTNKRKGKAELLKFHLIFSFRRAIDPQIIIKSRMTDGDRNMVKKCLFTLN